MWAIDCPGRLRCHAGVLYSVGPDIVSRPNRCMAFADAARNLPVFHRDGDSPRSEGLVIRIAPLFLHKKNFSHASDKRSTTGFFLKSDLPSERRTSDDSNANREQENGITNRSEALLAR
jgi:hypothetical protein